MYSIVYSLAPGIGMTYSTLANFDYETWGSLLPKSTMSTSWQLLPPWVGYCESPPPEMRRINSQISRFGFDISSMSAIIGTDQ